MQSPQFALEDGSEVMRGEALPLRPISYRCIVPGSDSRRSLPVAHVRAHNLAVLLSGADADPPRRKTTAGGASLGRSRPLASRVALRGTAVFGSDTERQLPAPWIGFRRYVGESTSENQAPTRCRGLGAIEHERDAFRRVVRAGTFVLARNRMAAALTPPSSDSRTRSQRALSRANRLTAIHRPTRVCPVRYVTRRRHVRLSVARPAGGP